jgi:hypothetical protein
LEPEGIVVVNCDWAHFLLHFGAAHTAKFVIAGIGIAALLAPHGLGTPRVRVLLI